MADPIPEGVSIVYDTVCSSDGRVFGMGVDQRMYEWNEFSVRWELHKK